MIRVKNWSDHQHYNDRSPPWIKLHKKLLDNRGWHALSGDASKLLAECWLLASDSKDGTINLSIEDLAWRLRRSERLTRECLQELVGYDFVAVDEIVASEPLAERLQGAPQRERERESRETEKENSMSADADVAPDQFEEVWKIHGRGSKKKAKAEYRKAVPKLATHEHIIDRLKAYRDAYVRPDFEGQHLERWIRDARWEENLNGNGRGPPKPLTDEQKARYRDLRAQYQRGGLGAERAAEKAMNEVRHE